MFSETTPEQEPPVSNVDDFVPDSGVLDDSFLDDAKDVGKEMVNERLSDR